MRIIRDNEIYAIPSKTDEHYDIFYSKESLIPYYDEQPKKLNFRKLKSDLFNDPKIKTGIEH